MGESDGDVDSGQSSCPICLSALSDARATLSCGHALCTECLVSLVKTSPDTRCPLCRVVCCRPDQACDDPLPQDAIYRAAQVATTIVRKVTQPTLDMAQSTTGGIRSLCFLVAFLAADLAAGTGIDSASSLGLGSGIDSASSGPRTDTDSHTEASATS